MSLFHARQKYYQLVLDNKRQDFDGKAAIHSPQEIQNALSEMKHCVRRELEFTKQKIEYLKSEQVIALEQEKAQLEQEYKMISDLAAIPGTHE